jgi:putative redox protein
MNPIQIESKTGKLQQQITIGRHLLTADVDTQLGGENAGPTPHEYLAAALGACTSMTMRMYAQRKNWPADGTRVTINLKEEGGVANFFREIRFPAALSQEQKDRLLEIAEKCPVHKTLLGKIEIQTITVAS